MKNWSYCLVVGILSGALILGAGYGITQAQQRDETHLKVATSNTSGTWYIVGAAFTKLFQEKYPSVKWNVQSSGASVENCRLVGTRQVQVGYAMSDVAYYAYKKEREFKARGFDNLRVLLGGNLMHYHLVTRNDSGIRNIRDLKGKKIYWGTPGSGTHLMNVTVLEAAGLKAGVDYTGVHLSLGDAVEAIKDGDIHAIGHCSGIPIPGIMDLFTTKDSRFIEIDDETLTGVSKKHFYWPKGAIPANSYAKQDKDVPTVECGTVLVTNTDLPVDIAYAITKTVIENSKDYKVVHRACEDYNIKNTIKATKESGIPFHPGTEKYLKEKGVL
ncbi:MAG: TAXI family TRAP transporter solute-binding subunit [Thermodesulfobacteriota bacterium]